MTASSDDSPPVGAPLGESSPAISLSPGRREIGTERKAEKRRKRGKRRET
jgi:hypothetical protein